MDAHMRANNVVPQGHGRKPQRHLNVEDQVSACVEVYPTTNCRMIGRTISCQVNSVICNVTFGGGGDEDAHYLRPLPNSSTSPLKLILVARSFLTGK